MKDTKRILAIDLARGVSVLMVVIVHTLWIYGDISTQSDTWLGEVIHFIGKGTPMFLIAMGVSFILSRNQSVFLSIKRAFYILAMGYLMNFLKFVFPILIGTVPDNFIQAYGWTSPATIDNMIYLLSTGDILQLAGMSLLFMGIINRFSKNKYVPLVLALSIAVVTREVHGLQIGVPGIDYVLDLLWGAEWNVYFAVFPWFSFILIGMFFGMWYKERNKSNNYLFSRMGIAGILLMLIGGGLCYYNFEYHFGDYFHLGPGGTLYLAGFNLVILWFANILVTRVKENRVFTFLYYCSKRVTTIYVIQWVLICWGMGALGYQQFGITGVLLLIPFYILLTLGVQKFLLDKLLFSQKSKKGITDVPKKQIAVQKT
ncbi:heparan-alpha-glucosaminide N-acetyltransferase domain-containing protein [Aquimarina sp. 2201CG5-10]|uniref:heparan-alpha-glucosaminide N-acetyltransferase domain-containing protein n=1 Tax=Aquimarina callyspongiae TaxID=3098150 RepID=UPI002AB4B1A2|nr:heparan-alpha-glucosaminide N-acetyltransferase domain-containing protein [Aquimarina sp. 2201CG5-10]MDY8135936.1 heparan-alpha-glucosaminide N-acetyltransferase domain-containing protein [Aquimarina sp. 2201CG5-10]